ncbi:MAG TPA: polysaccharide biosynthesis/export family protein [Edaphobacter sp.]
MRPAWLFLILCLSVLAGSGSAFAQFNGPAVAASTPINLPIELTTDPAILYPQQRDIRLGNGDTIQVHIYGSSDYNAQAVVSLDGSVNLPLAGVLHVEGLTIHETEITIAEALVRGGIYRNPQVSVQLTESPNQVATLTGELRSIVPLRGEKRLLDVISAGGGFPQTASHVVTIHRIGQEKPIVVDLGTNPSASMQANIPIFAGDTIVTSRTGVVYILGAFKTQGSIPLMQNSPMTLMQAAALSGGPAFDAKYGDLRLVRTIGVERKIVHVDIKRVMQGKDPDPVLQADDIVFLPTVLMKSAIKSGGLGTLLGFASLLLIAVRN